MVDTMATSTTLVDLLRWRAVRQPDQRAYTFLLEEEGEVHITYAELDRKARAIAAFLQAHGPAGERALLLYPPGLEYISAFFGCLYAGVNAVPAYPPRMNGNLSRLQAIAGDAQAAFALTTSAILTNVEERFATSTDLQVNWLVTDDIADELAEQWHPPLIDRHTLAFLQYTSGSTSLPKGVMLSHGNLLHNLQLIHESFDITADSNCVIWLPPYHDMGLIGGILQPFFGGYPVTLMSPVSFVQRPLRWLETISKNRATLSGGPNFAYELCVQKITPEQRETLDLSTWRTAFTGAEPIRPDTLERFVQAFATCGFRREAFYPCYGLAESTLFVTGGLRTAAPIVQTFDGDALKDNRIVEVSPEHAEARTLVGCGHARTEQLEVAIVDPASQQRVADDQVGEIWVAGPSVAAGYWNLAKRSAETFGAQIADTGEGPFLRTGDLGFLKDGELYVTGRLKDLIIIRGRNYYPQDVEYTMQTCHPALKPDFGAAFSVDVDREERLVVVQEIDRQFRKSNLDEVVAAVRQAVAEQHQLQVYAVVLIKPASIPKTSSGKIQRHACRERFLNDTLDVVKRDVLDGLDASVSRTGKEWDEQTGGQTTVEVSRDLLLGMNGAERVTALEANLLAKSAQVLKLSPALLDTQKPLSQFGLDSLMAVELKNSIEDSTGVILPVVTFLEGPSIELLVQKVLAELEQATSDGHEDAVKGAIAAGEFPSSYGQRALWFMQRLAPESAAYNISHVVKIGSTLDVKTLRQAFVRLARRHPLLRATFHLRGEDVIQRIAENGTIPFTVHEASQWSETELQQRLSEEAHRPFDLEKGPLVRVQVFSRNEQEHLLQLTLHHIIVDFWSLSVLVNELRTLYPLLQQGDMQTLTESLWGYADYVTWQAQMLKSSEGETHLSYWKKQLGGSLPVLHLPTDRPRPPVQTYNGATHAFHLPSALTERVKTLAKERGVTVFTLLLSAFHVLLHRYTGQEDILVGSPTAGRSRAKQADLIGYFVNPVALRASFTEKLTFAAFLEQVKGTVFAALEHQDFPFPLLVEKLQPERDPSYPPIFQTMFVLQKSHLLDDEGLTAFAVQDRGAKLSGALPFEAYSLEHHAAQFDLTLMVADVEGGLAGSMEYNTDLFNASTVARMAGHFHMLLEGIVADPEEQVAKLPLLTPQERHQMLVEWTNTQKDNGQDRLVQHVFEEMVAQQPDAVALRFEELSMTYGELNQRANQLAHHLRGLGVTRETLVGICTERSFEMIIAMFGVFKSGGAYVPLDPTYPAERIAFMLDDAKPLVLLTKSHLVEQLPPTEANVVCLDSDWASIAVESGENFDNGVQLPDLAYVIYTSGSTGKPKGVLVTHTGINNAIQGHLPDMQVGKDSRVLQFASFSFDASVSEILSALLTGATLYLAKRETLMTGQGLVKLLQEEQITHGTIPPSVLMLIAEHEFPHLHTIISAGEAISREMVLTWRNKGHRLVNGYGPTECTIGITWELMDGERLPYLGHPVANTYGYLVDKHMQPVPIGVPGELLIGGVGVARGYLNRPDLTAEKFIQDPFSEEQDRRVYRTGDLIRYWEDGTMEYLGRIDHQVKIRGFRIEIGEIEQLLADHEAVRQTVVEVREDVPGQKRLVAYVAPHSGKEVTGADLRVYLKQKLPEYMVPSAYVLLDVFPLSPNGKVDRRALPVPDSSQRDLETEYVPPSNETERKITEVWQEVLQLEKVGVHDNFFDLGGHSLLVTVAHGKIQERLGQEFSVVEMFSYPTISALSKFLAQQLPETPTIEEFKDRAGKQRDAINRRKQLIKDRRKHDE